MSAFYGVRTAGAVYLDILGSLSVLMFHLPGIQPTLIHCSVDLNEVNRIFKCHDHVSTIGLTMLHDLIVMATPPLHLLHIATLIFMGLVCS
jgi:hypothetical protein